MWQPQNLARYSYRPAEPVNSAAAFGKPRTRRLFAETTTRSIVVTWLLAGLCFTGLCFTGLCFTGLCAPVLAEDAGVETRTPLAEDAESTADAQPAVAQSATFVEEITVTASRGPRSIKDASGTVTVIGSDQIEQMLASDFRDLVKYVPGVYVESSPGGEGLSGINIRGIGGNRVLTRIDGMASAEQFEFSPFTVPQPALALDPDTVQSLEILRSAGSPLYGSDALGGVVSLVTKDPADYLAGGERFYTGLRAGYDSRDGELSEGLTLAAGGSRWQGSVLLGRRDGEESDNRGDNHSFDSSRTVLDPRDWQASDLLAKLVFLHGTASSFEFAAESLARDTETRRYSSQRVSDQSFLLGPGLTRIVEFSDAGADDRRRRERFSLEHALEGGGGMFDRLLWRAFQRSADTRQNTVEVRSTTQGGGFLGPLTTTNVERSGVLTFGQDTIGGGLQMQKSLGFRNHSGSRPATGGPTPPGALLTWGFSFSRDRFEQLRDSRDHDLDTGQPATGGSAFVFPTRYFPRSTVSELGAYLQSEVDLAGGRLRLIPGLRYDAYELDADQQDAVYLEGNRGVEPPADMRAEAVSPRLGVTFEMPRDLTLYGQWAKGFRAPPMSAVNSGFTSLVFGVTRLPNPDLEPETSDNYELGLRGSFRRGGFSLVGFDNNYRDFIELVVVGFNPAAGLLEFQNRNVKAARISGLEVAADLRIRKSWTARMSFAAIDGEDRDQRLPLNSVPPEKLVLGLSYAAPGGRWGSALHATRVTAKSRDEVDDSAIAQFRPPGYDVLDLTGYWHVSDRLSFELGIFNLLDEKYWQWADVLGQEQSSMVLDRYTSPGVGVGAALRYRR